MHVIRSDGIDVAGRDTSPKRLAIIELAQRWVDLTDIATAPIDIVREVVWTSLDHDIGSRIAGSQRGLQGFARRGMDDVKPCPGFSCKQSGALHSIRFNKWRTRRIPGP